MTKSDFVKSQRLINLEAWARARYAQGTWRSPEFREALRDKCLVSWGVSEGAAKNMSNIVQKRMVLKEPPALETQAQAPQVLPVMEQPHEEGSVAEMIAKYRRERPEEFAVPTTDFRVVEE